MLQIEMPKAGDGHANTRRCTRIDTLDTHESEKDTRRCVQCQRRKWERETGKVFE